MAQEIIADRRWRFEVIVGLDAKAPEPDTLLLRRVETLITPGVALRWSRATKPGRAAAANAAVRAATGGVLAFLDDDDRWDPRWLTIATHFLADFDLVSSSQTMVGLSGEFVETFDFAVPSTWVMRRGVWEGVGGMDEEFWCHADTDLLGRVNAARWRRVHLVEGGVRGRKSTMLRQVARHSAIAEMADPNPLVTRTVNPGGITEEIRRGRSARRYSRENHEKMMERYGYFPF